MVINNMRPKILKNYKNEELEVMLRNSKSGELWITKFIPLRWGDIEHSNAVSLYKKNGFFNKETLTVEEFNAIFNALNESGFEEICLLKQDKYVLVFSKYKDQIGSINGIQQVIKKVSNEIKIRCGISYIDTDRCCIVANKNWDDANKPRGLYTLEDLS
jgi:hypothetical protein